MISPAEEGTRERPVELPGGPLNFTYAKHEARSRFLLSTEDDVAVVIETDEAVPLRVPEERWLLSLQGLVTFAGRDHSLIEGLTVAVPDDTEVHPIIRHANPHLRWGELNVDVPMRLPTLTADPRYDHDRPI